MTSTLLDRRNAVFGSGAHLFYRQPINIVRASGVSLFDENGTEYTDMYNNVPSIGHCHPHYVEKVTTQLSTLNTHNRYLHENIVSYGERLANKHHSAIENVVFSCTGTEANEVALMMMRLFTGGEGIVCTDAAYHGNSAAVKQLSRPKNNPLVRSFPFPESYRVDAEDPSEHFLEELDAAITSFDKDHVKFAGLVICSLCANEGLPDVPAGFMQRAVEMVHAAGGLVVADEVQAGLGRAGCWWGYEHSEFTPDIVVMGKPLGAGMPLAATASSKEIVEHFRQNTGYFNTFASSPVQGSAGNAVLDVIENEDLLDNAQVVGTYLRDRITEIVKDFEAIDDIRQKGLFLALECVASPDTKTPNRGIAVDIVNRLKDRRFLIGNAGAYGNVLKIRPPLVFSKANADEFLTAFEDVIGQF